MRCMAVSTSTPPSSPRCGSRRREREADEPQRTAGAEPRPRGQHDRDRRAVDRHAAAVALGGRPHDRQARGRSPGGRPRRARARSARRRARGRPGRARGPRRARPAPRVPPDIVSETATSPPRGPWTSALSSRLSSARRSASGSPRTVTGVARADARARRGPPPPRATSASRRTVAIGRRAGALALERQQVVDQALQPRGVELQVGQHLRVDAVARDELDVAGQRGHRRAQLVAGVGEEAALAQARGVERGEHPVERARSSSADLVVGVRVGQPARRRRRCARSRPPPTTARERPQAAAREQRRGGAAHRRRRASPESRSSRPSRCSVCSMSVVLEATSTAPPAAGPPSSGSGAA